MRRSSLWLAPAVLLAAALPAWAQSVVRGPYLNRGSSTAVVVRWRTSSATDSRVRYGTVQGSLTLSASDAASVTDHVVTLTGLQPDTKYYYSVGTSAATLAGNDASHFFVTSPPAGTAKPTRIWVIGDAGTATSSQTAVKNAYYSFTGNTHTDFWLMLGDNAYNDGTDAEYQTAVYDMYPTLLRKSVVWSTLGNHDGHSADSATQTGPYYSMFTFPKSAEAGGIASGTEAYYSFDYGNIHFICLDSYDTSRSSTGPMAGWLRQDIAATSLTWIIAFWHHPPYTKGSHNSDSETALIEMRQNFLPILEDAGVDLVLSGHSHSYERSFLIDGHYGSSTTFTNAHKKDGGSGRDANAYQKPGNNAAHAGAVYAVAGSSGKISGGTLNHPAMYISLNNLGSVVLDVNGARLDYKFLRETGAVADYFTMLKGPTTPDTTPPAVSITNPTSASTYTASSTPLVIGGTASDNVGVTQVTWTNAANGASGTANGTTAWSASVLLVSGSNAVTVTARDAAGNTATDTITVSYTAPDTTAPAVTITTPTTAATHATAATPLAIGGTASDNVGVTQVTWTNGANGASGTATGTASWTASVPLAAGSNLVTVTARDAAGNTATDSLTVTYSTGDTTPPSVTITSPVNGTTHSTSATPLALGGSASDNVGVTQVTWTNAATGGSGTASGTASWTASVALASGSNLVTVTARDAAGNTATDAITVTYSPPAGDTTPPTVSIQSPTTGSTYASSSPQIVVSGGASDNATLGTVTWSNAATGLSGTANGTTTWDATIDLAAGSNAITITAFDASGNSATDTITVTYSGGGGGGGGVAAAGVDLREHDNGNQCPFGVVAPGGIGPWAWLLTGLALLALGRRP